MAKKKKRGAAKKAAKRKKKREARTEVETHVNAKMAKELDAATVSGGFVTFEVFGDTIGGEILAIEVVKSRWGPQKKVTVKTDDGSKTFFCSTMLDKYFDEHGVGVGDVIGVRYHSTAPSGKGAPAKLFKVVHQPTAGRRRKR